MGKGGRLEEMSTPSCGHVNEAKRTSCSVCECALIGNPGRPEVKLSTHCPSCGHIHEATRATVLCVHVL